MITKRLLESNSLFVTSWVGVKCVKPVIINVVVKRKEKVIKRCTPVTKACHFYACTERHYVGKSVPFSHPFQYLGRGNLGVWQNRVQRKSVVGQRVHTRSLLLRCVARSISDHERSWSAIS